jgi:hypothetical protein
MTFEFNLTLKISKNWIEDGADPCDPEWRERIEEKIQEILPYAYGSEIKVELKPVKLPDHLRILRLQGYVKKARKLFRIRKLMAGRR